MVWSVNTHHMLSVCMCVGRNNAVLLSALSGAKHQVRDLSLVPPAVCHAGEKVQHMKKTKTRRVK